MSERRAKGCLVAALVWCVILGVLGVAYKFLVHPYLSEKLKGETSSQSHYKDEIVVAADSFSGYAILRSESLRADLQSRQIRLTLQDDKADYASRLRALKEGRCQMAVFTVDSLITGGAAAGEFPGTIVLILDETKGGDAIVARRTSVPSLQDLNDPAARIVVTPDSPSEFLARVVIAHFDLPRLPSQWAVEADGAAAVFQQFQSDRPGARRAYVLWEPYVSRALAQPDAHVLLDTSRLKGYIVDVLVAQREFLRDHPDRVRTVVEAYLRAAYDLNQTPDGLATLVRQDARATGSEALDETQAGQIAQGIQWKNTLENYAHFGLLPAADRGGLPLLEDIIGNIIEVLVRTKALASDPLASNHHTLFYDRILRDLQSSGFHPGKELNLIRGAGPDGKDPERVRGDGQLARLDTAQWNQLRPVGELRIDPVLFSRGSAGITVQSERDLQSLARRLESFPRFYLRVMGHARAEGDPEANRQLAQSRAEAVTAYLTGQGVAEARIRAEAGPSPAQGGQAQAVSFVVGQLPY
jgi:outer membrane protein OmpA-like peptidoglycan-associated protein